MLILRFYIYFFVGSFASRTKTEVLHGERRTLIKHDDNLYPEGKNIEKILIIKLNGIFNCFVLSFDNIGL